MNAESKIKAPDGPVGLDKLREPFAEHQISKLPKETRKQIDERKNRVQGCMVWKCPDCGNAHHKDAIHLDYVGHAALTDRLLDTDPFWSWEPVAFNEHGLPAFDQSGGLWIKLTVCGVTRLGYGHAASKPNADPGAREKEVIGDALRNAAMRFGAALDLWHKGDLHGGPEPEGAAEPEGMPDAEWAKLVQLVEATKSDLQAMCEHYKVSSLRELSIEQYSDAIRRLKTRLAEKMKQEKAAKERLQTQPEPVGEFDELDADSIPY